MEMPNVMIRYFKEIKINEKIKCWLKSTIRYFKGTKNIFITIYFFKFSTIRLTCEETDGMWELYDARVITQGIHVVFPTHIVLEYLRGIGISHIPWWYHRSGERTRQPL